MRTMTEIPYCDSDLCANNGKFCCGHNECCFAWTLYYLWMALSLGIFIGIYFVLRCYHQKRQSLVQNLKINKKTDEKKMVTSKHVVYMPLNSSAYFTENKIDDFNIQFDVVKQSDY